MIILDENGNVLDPLPAGVTFVIDPDGAGTHVVQVNGLDELWTVKILTTDTFNRFHIEAIEGAFDIGRIDLADKGLIVTTNVGNDLFVDDDGPVVDLAANGAAALVVDETADDGDEGGSGFLAQQSILAANYLSINDGDAGTDGKQADVFSFEDPGTDQATGLTDTVSGEAVVLNLDGGDIVGTTVSGNVEVMRWQIDATTGEVTLTLKRAIVHDDSPDDHDENDDPEMLSGTGLIVVKREITDNDGDTGSDTADITAIFKF